MLFTSYKALYRAAEMLKGGAFEILVQGDMPKRELLMQFQKTDRCVLLGTQSFWEGVDVRGQQLRCVIIDKLPFLSPGDPLVQARSQVIQEAGENPFMVYQVPQAILNLKQGVGRLIRGEQDYGVVALMDPRITSKAYGKMFVKSLPAMTVTQHESDVTDFLEMIKSYEATCD
jgi:ATP-dependent DNA helicase DinG